MYSDGERKTLTEMQREAEATRSMIAEEARQLERIKRAAAKTQFSIDQLFRFFAREVTAEEEKKMLLDLLQSNPADVHMECVPLLPVATAIANGRMTNARRIYAAQNQFIDDSSLIFFVHVLRFSPQSAQVDYVDISGTKVTVKGLYFMLEMMSERSTLFTLVARQLWIDAPKDAPAESYGGKYLTMLRAAKDSKHCTVVLE